MVVSHNRTFAGVIIGWVGRSQPGHVRPARTCFVNASCLHSAGWHSRARRHGEVAEWLKAPHSKCGVRVTVPGVRIPPSPPALAPLHLERCECPAVSEMGTWRCPCCRPLAIGTFKSTIVDAPVGWLSYGAAMGATRDRPLLGGRHSTAGAFKAQGNQELGETAAMT